MEKFLTDKHSYPVVFEETDDALIGSITISDDETYSYSAKWIQSQVSKECLKSLISYVVCSDAFYGVFKETVVDQTSKLVDVFGNNETLTQEEVIAKLFEEDPAFRSFIYTFHPDASVVA